MSVVYISTSRANAGGGLVAVACRVSVLALRLRGLLAAPVRINIRRRDFIPARLALPAPVYKHPRFAYFPPFWRRFGVAVVSSAGAVSLRPFRWCRCAYKVAAPRVPCFRPCSWPLVSLAAVLACWCPCVCPRPIFPPPVTTGTIPRHTGAPCVY